MKEKKQESSESVAEENKVTEPENLEASTWKNPWKIIAVILGIGVIILLILMFRGGITGNVISESSASDKIVEYLNSRTGGGVAFVSVEDAGGSLYEVTVSYKGDEIPVYVTKDGKYFVQGAIPIAADATGGTDSETQQQEVPKSDKPKVEAFIFSYCPYGLQFEKALFPVYDLLKSKAGIDIVAIGAMHGEFEKQESLRQISIEQLYGRDKLFAYLKEFDTNTNIGSCSGDDACLSKYLPAIYTKLGIDKTKIENYMKTNALAIYDEQNARASELGISGSPTFVINDVQVQVGRTPDAIKQAICSAFNTAPSECQQTLSTQSTSAGFGSVTNTAGHAATDTSCG